MILGTQSHRKAEFKLNFFEAFDNNLITVKVYWKNNDLGYN